MKTTLRIRMLTVSLVVVTAVSIGFISYGGYQNLIAEQQRQGLESQVSSESGRLELALHELHNDVRLLASLPLIENVAAELNQPAPPQGTSASSALLAEVFREMLRAKGFYTQIRLIGVADGGQEIVRVNRENGSVNIVPADQLQQKGNRDYFVDAIQLPPGKVYFSHITLNREHGRIQEPHCPTLRAAVRVDTPSASPFGIVIINLDYSSLIASLFDPANSPYAFYMTNNEGDYLVHPDPTKTFGFDLGMRFRVQDEFPETADLFAPDHTTATALTTSNGAGRHRLVHFRRVFAFQGDADRFVTLGLAAPSEFLTAGSLAVTRSAALTTLVLVVCALVVGYLAATVLTRPIEQVTLAAKQFGRGEAISSLPVERDDEVGVLARTFEHMAEALRMKELESVDLNNRLVSANDDLEHLVHIAAHDLREPLRKQRNFVDLLRDEFSPDHDRETSETLDYIYACSSQMQTLVDSFRELTAVGQANLVRQTVAIKALIQECLAEFNAECTQRNIDIRFDSFPESVDVYPALVTRLYSHLIRNALDHTESRSFTLAFTAAATDLGWTFGVRNTGSTIPRHHCQEVLRVFRHADQRHPEGRGIGLAICQYIVRRHRGTIVVESSEDDVHVKFTLGAVVNDN